MNAKLVGSIMLLAVVLFSGCAYFQPPLDIDPFDDPFGPYGEFSTFPPKNNDPFRPLDPPFFSHSLNVRSQNRDSDWPPVESLLVPEK